MDESMCSYCGAMGEGSVCESCYEAMRGQGLAIRGGISFLSVQSFWQRVTFFF